MNFSPLLITPLVLTPLRYFFATYTASHGLIYDEDEKIRTIDIADIHDYHDIGLQERPRILVDRGSYQIQKTGVSDNLAEGKSLGETHGLMNNINMLLYYGTAQMIIQARHKGTCDLIADMATHFIAWARPTICDTQGFKEFGLPMNVSECGPANPGEEDTDKFQVVVQLPYIREEQWRIRNDGVKLKNMLLQISQKA